MTTPAETRYWPAAAGEMAALIRSYDWAATPLGVADNWPQALRFVVNLLLVTPLPMVLFWGRQQIQIYNDAAIRLQGSEHPRCLGRPVAPRWHEQWDLDSQVLNSVLTGQPLAFENKSRLASKQGIGEPAWYTLSFSPVLDGESHVGGVLMTASDTTRQIHGEKELYRQEQRFRALVTATSYAVFRMSADWKHMLELDGHGVVADCRDPSGDWVQKYIYADDQQDVLKAVDAAVRVGRMFELEHRIVRSDGAIGWTLSRAIPVRGNSNEIVEWFGAATDITARKTWDASLRESARRNVFLLALTDAVRKIEDTVELIATASELLGLHMGAGQVAYAEIDEQGEYATISRDWNDGTIPSNAARHRLEEFGPAFIADLAKGKDIIIEDVRTDQRTSTPEALATFRRVSIGGFLNIPLVRRGRLAAVLAVHSRLARPWSDSDVAVAKEVANRLWIAVERNRAEVALRYSEAQFRQFGEASTDLLWIRHARTLEWEYVSPAFEEIYGEAAGDFRSVEFEKRWTHLIHGGDRMRVYANLARIQLGESLHHEFRIRRAIDSQFRWIQSTDFPILDESGEVRHIAGIARDVTEEKETADRMQILLAELDHRTRNLIVVIGSIVKRTLAASDSLRDFKETFDPRLTALGHVNALLLRPNQLGQVTFDALLETVFRGHGLEAELQQSRQIRFQGEKNIQLKSSHVQTLGLALHELLTNAMKYGALADAAGELEVRWTMSGGYDERLSIEWLESRVSSPNDSEQQTRGYGRELIEEALPYQLKAVTSYELGPDRLRCTISLPGMAVRSPVLGA